MVIKENISLLKLNTFRVNARARYLAELNGAEDFLKFLDSDYGAIRPRVILGGGSNVLFRGDFEGCIIKPEIKGIELVSISDDFVEIRAGAGENWDDFVSYCVEKGYGGLENLSYIPGTVGAGPIQNIGAYGMEIKDSIISVECIELETSNLLKFLNSQCRFSYRNSIFKSELKNMVLITHVTFRLNRHPVPVTGYSDLLRELENYPHKGIKEVRSAVIDIRKRKLPDPIELPNAGSFFKNPYVDRHFIKSLQQKYERVPSFDDGQGNIKLSAAWLIEQCGYKGRREKDTGTHVNQPLVIVNYGNATGEEILTFAAKIQGAVRTKFAIDLEKEVNII